MIKLSTSIVLALTTLVLSVSAFAADEMTPANQAIEAAKAKTRASGSPYGDQSAPNTRLSSPSALNLEILGRGLLWSVTFDQAMSNDLSAGFGIGTVGTTGRGSTISANIQAVIVPIYVNYYFAPSARSFFGTAGVNLVTNNRKVQNLDAETSGVEFGTSAVAPTFGAGFESRGDNGFLFRLAAYGVFSNDTVAPWFGFTFGYAF